jgi:hypothetical protein
MDENGRVYCKKLSSVAKHDNIWDLHCLDDYDRLSGSLQGEDVECLWYDADYDCPMVHIYDPYAEYARFTPGR